MTKLKVDPITLQVIGGALHAIAEQMGNVLYRMSYSSIIRESQDLGAGLFDVNFNTLCESESTPMHIGSIPGYLRGFGISLVPAILTLFGVCGVRIVWINTVFPLHHTFRSIMLVYPISLATTAVLIFIALLVYRPSRRFAARTAEKPQA